MSDPLPPPPSSSAPPPALAELPLARTAGPAAPLVTFYDDASGERTELSGRTFGNWVAKTANLLVDGLGAQPGDEVALALPPHWQTAVWLFACWSAGLVAAPVEIPLDPEAPDVDAAAVLAVTEADLPRALEAGGAQEIVGLSLHALGGPLRDCPPGVTDYAVEVRSYGDRFEPPVSVKPDTPALRVMSITLSAAEVVAEALSYAHKHRLDATTRVLTTGPYHTVEGLSAGLLAPIAAGGSVVVGRNIDKTALGRRISLEHVTAVTGVPGWDPPSGSVYRLP